MTVKLSLPSIAETFRVTLIWSVCEAFHSGSIASQLHAITVHNGINLSSSGGASSEDGGVKPWAKTLLFPPVDLKVIILSVIFPFRPQTINCVSCFCFILSSFPSFFVF